MDPFRLGYLIGVGTVLIGVVLGIVLGRLLIRKP
jgi:uncharacterized membrane protein (DUF4010 family)